MGTVGYRGWAVTLRKEACHYCKQSSGTIDHKKSRAKGGANGKDNCVPCCKKCNNLKADISYEAFRDFINLREANLGTSPSHDVLLSMCPRCGCTNPQRKFLGRHPVQRRNCRTCKLSYPTGAIFEVIEGREE